MSANPKVSPAKIIQALIANQQALANEVFSRSKLARGTKLDPDERDLAGDCGYPSNPTIRYYRELVRRNGIAQRAAYVYPDESFLVYPELYQFEDVQKQGPWDKRWQQLLNRPGKNPITYIHRADRCSGIGSCGILLLGISDGKPLSEPVEGITEQGEAAKTVTQKDLLYMMPFAEDNFTIENIESNANSPRCGQPSMYAITMMSPSSPVGRITQSPIGTVVSDKDTIPQRVHWSRVIHVADNRESSEVYGTPRLEAILDYLFDCRKVGGGSAEMFWRGAFPGYSFETLPELTEDAELDEATIKEQFDDYANGLKRYLALTGMTVKQLAPQVADPSNHLGQYIGFICASIGVPIPIFMGHQLGHLAGTQDTGNWNRRLSGRQLLYLSPYLIHPFVDRLMKVGIMPRIDRYFTAWRDLNSMTDIQKADVALKKAQALMQYVSGGCETVIGRQEFLTLILGMTVEEAKAIEKARPKIGKGMTTKLVWDSKTGVAAPQGGGRNGKASRKTPGRPAGKTPAA